MKIRIALMIVLLAITPGARAQEAAAADRGAFEAAVESYRDQVRVLGKLWSDFQTADESQRQTMNQELGSQMAEANLRIRAMVDEALKLYQANPGADQEVTDLLLSVAEHQVVGKSERGGGDQYEQALPILKALIDGGHKKAELPLWGVLAAVATNEFDLADQFAKIAVESGAVGATPDESEEAQATFALAMRYLQEKDRYRARWETEKAIREKEAAADDLPRVKLTLAQGDVVIELFEDQAPTATANFLELVAKGYYDGVPFHRVLPRFMAQGGDPTGSGSGGPGYRIACECYRNDFRRHFRGTLSMAHAGRDTGGSQFFLCFLPTDFLDGDSPRSHHTAFGRVVEGIDLIGVIQVLDPQKGGPDPDRIIKAEVIRKRDHDYDFEKLPERRVR